MHRYKVFIFIIIYYLSSCKNTYNHRLYVVSYEIIPIAGSYEKKLVLANLNDTENLDTLNFDITSYVKKNKIYFSCGDNKKKYTLNDTIQLLNNSYKIVGIVYNDKDYSASVMGYPEKNFLFHDSISNPLFDIELIKWAEASEEYRKNWLQSHKEAGGQPTGDITPPTTCTNLSLKSHISIILVKKS